MKALLIVAVIAMVIIMTVLVFIVGLTLGMMVICDVLDDMIAKEVLDEPDYEKLETYNLNNDDLREAIKTDIKYLIRHPLMLIKR